MIIDGSPDPGSCGDSTAGAPVDLDGRLRKALLRGRRLGAMEETQIKSDIWTGS